MPKQLIHLRSSKRNGTYHNVVASSLIIGYAVVKVSWHCTRGQQNLQKKQTFGKT